MSTRTLNQQIIVTKWLGKIIAVYFAYNVQSMLGCEYRECPSPYGAIYNQFPCH